MKAAPPSGAVTTGHRLVTGLLVLAFSFGVLTLASIGVGPARDGDSLLYGDTLRVPLQLPAGDVGPLPAGLSVDSSLDADVEVHNPTPEQMFLRSAQDLGPLVLMIAGLWLLRGFMRSVKDGDPFGPANVGRLRRLGFILVAGAPVVEIVNYWLRSALFSELPTFPSVNLGLAWYSLPAAALLGGPGAFILAEVFAYGTRLREDAEGTI